MFCQPHHWLVTGLLSSLYRDFFEKRRHDKVCHLLVFRNPLVVCHLLLSEPDGTLSVGKEVDFVIAIAKIITWIRALSLGELPADCELVIICDFQSFSSACSISGLRKLETAIDGKNSAFESGDSTHRNLSFFLQIALTDFAVLDIFLLVGDYCDS